MPIMKPNWMAMAALLAGITSHAFAGAPVDTGALDPTFGSSGKVQMRAFATGGASNPTQFVAYDTAIQPNGKIVLVGGYEDGGNDAGWMVSQLNDDGSLDTSFQGGSGTFSQPGYYFPFFSSNTEAQARAVALRPDGHIVVAGSVLNAGTLTGALIQLNANGTPDATWRDGNGSTFLFGTGAPSDAIRLRRMVLDAGGEELVVGSFTHGSNGNSDFYFAKIGASGLSGIAVIQELSLGGAHFDGATDIAIDSHGNYIVGGYASSAAGDVDCIAVRILAATDKIDPTFGTSGVARVSFNLGGDNNDFCDSLAVAPGGSIFLGGHGTATANAGTYQAALFAWLDSDGVVVRYGLGTSALLAFDYTGQSLRANDGNTINKFLIQHYATLPIAVGYNNDPHVGFPFTGDDFAVERFTVSTQNGSLFDPSFHAGTSVLTDWGSYQIGSFHFTSQDRVQSAVFDAHGRLVVVGYAGDEAGGGDLAVVRFAAFDGIFKNGFENPAY
jgi:uncharacterized delta-60 repeat protein